MYYKLTAPFEGYKEETVFKRVAVYGDDQLAACKLEALNQGGVDTKRLTVDDEELDSLFVETERRAA